MAVFETRIARDVALTGSERAHMRAATRELRTLIEKDSKFSAQFTQQQLRDIKAGKPNIDGLTWHHHQDLGRMQLIPRDVHYSTGHIGGLSLWKRGVHD